MQPSPHRTNAHASLSRTGATLPPVPRETIRAWTRRATNNARSGRAASTVGHDRNLGSSESRPCGGKAVPAVDALTRTFQGAATGKALRGTISDQDVSRGTPGLHAGSGTEADSAPAAATTPVSLQPAKVLWPNAQWLTGHGSRVTAHGSRLTAHGSRLTSVMPQDEPPTATPHEIPVARAVRHRVARVVSRETAPQETVSWRRRPRQAAPPSGTGARVPRPFTRAPAPQQQPECVSVVAWRTSGGPAVPAPLAPGVASGSEKYTTHRTRHGDNLRSTCLRGTRPRARRSAGLGSQHQ
jgi:hypothetical protein